MIGLINMHFQAGFHVRRNGRNEQQHGSWGTRCTGCSRGLSLRSTWAESEWIVIRCGLVVSQASRALFIFICLHNTCLPSNRKALPHLQTLEAQCDRRAAQAAKRRDTTPCTPFRVSKLFSMVRSTASWAAFGGDVTALFTLGPDTEAPIAQFKIRARPSPGIAILLQSRPVAAL